MTKWPWLNDNSFISKTSIVRNVLLTFACLSDWEEGPLWAHGASSFPSERMKRILIPGCANCSFLRETVGSLVIWAVSPVHTRIPAWPESDSLGLRPRCVRLRPHFCECEFRLGVREWGIGFRRSLCMLAGKVILGQDPESDSIRGHLIQRCFIVQVGRPRSGATDCLTPMWLIAGRAGCQWAPLFPV